MNLNMHFGNAKLLRRATLRLLLAATLWPAAALAATPGSAAPEFVLDGRNGPVSLAAYKGKYVYLDFWASWCGPCRHSFPWMGALQKRYAGAGLQVVAINVDTSRADAQRFLAENPADFVVAYDPAGAVARQYAIKGMPSSLLIGPDGKVIQVHAGFNDDMARRIDAELQMTLKKP
jgi:cytochrome c biogenesis protein CcmG/thiol:disulfide interchange protein DsbE